MTADHRWAVESSELLVELFSSLADVFSTKSKRELPHWIALNGDKWPFFETAIKLASNENNRSWIQAIEMIAKITGSDPDSRWRSYQELLLGKNRAQLWLHESKHRDDRIIGPTTFKIQALYKRAGLEIIGAELADHISLELAFLSFLTEQIINNDEAQKN